MSKIITIKDKNNKDKAYFTPQDGTKDCYVDCRLNGESTLDFLIPASHEKARHITPECRIYASNRVYYLLEDDAIDTTVDDEGKKWTKVMAKELWYELDKSYVEPYLSNDPNTPTPADLAVIIVGGGSDLSDGAYSVGSAGHALYAILDGTDWNIGTVDVDGVHDLEMEKVSRLQLIKQIQAIWGGYLVFDSVNKIISLRSPLTWNNTTGFEIRYAKNLKHITRTQSNKIFTRIYPFGKDNLDIASVNDGVKYIANNTYTEKDYVGIFTDNDITNPQTLKEKAELWLSLYCKPRNLYKAKIVDLRILPEYSHEYFSIGDIAKVIHPEVGISEQARIIRHRFNLFQPWDCEIELGDPEERFEEMLKKTLDSSNLVSNTFTSEGYMSGFKLEDLSVNDQKITSLSADKITAGTIEALIKIIGPEIVGGIITGGIIRTAASGERIELSGNQYKTYNASNKFQGLMTSADENQYGDMYFYDGTVSPDSLPVFRIFNNGLGGGVSLHPLNGAGLSIGANEHNTRFFGNVADCIWHGTQAQAAAKTDWIDGQYADIEGSKASIGGTINFPLPENVDGSTLTFQECGNRFNEIGYLCNLLTGRLNVIINYLTETTEEMEVDPNL